MTGKTTDYGNDAGGIPRGGYEPALAGRGETLGIFFGMDEVCVSVYERGECRVLLRMPAYVAVSKVGEVLAGDRAIRYQSCHAGAQLYSALGAMRQGGGRRTAKTVCGGMEIHALRLCDGLVRELVRELGRTPYRQARECILSVPSFCFQLREYLKRLLVRAGLGVRRVLTAMTASGLYLAYASGLLDSGNQDTCFVNCAVSGDVLEFGLLRTGDGIEEVCYKAECAVPAGGPHSAREITRIPRHALANWMEKDSEEAQLFGGYQAYQRIVSNSNYYVFAEGNSMVPGRDVGDLGDCAASGSALLGALLKNRPGTEEFLLIDATPLSYGLEVCRAHGPGILRELQWGIREHTTFPAKKQVFEYERGSNGEDEDLRLWIGHPGTEAPEVIIVSLDPIRPFVRKARRLQLSLSLDAGETPEIILRDSESGEEQRRTVWLDVADRPSPSEGREVTFQQVCGAVCEEIGKFRGELGQLSQPERNSPVGQGLALVEKQCGTFLGKYGARSGGAQDMDGLLRDILQIVDGLEYGLRNTAECAGRPGLLLCRCYQEFLDLLAEQADVRPIEAEGCLFDSSVHAAIAHEEKEGLAEGVVTEELQRGYLWGSRMLRPATVRTAN